MFDTVKLYFTGLINKTEVIGRLRYEKPNYQVALRTQEVIQQALHFTGSEKTMSANPILLQMKYARVVERFAEICHLGFGEALDFFYHSQEYQLISQGVSDLHCMSYEYLAEDLQEEYRKRA